MRATAPGQRARLDQNTLLIELRRQIVRGRGGQRRERAIRIPFAQPQGRETRAEPRARGTHRRLNQFRKHRVRALRQVQREQAVGYVTYVDRFAGTLRGLRDRLPYLRELGISYLHLMPLLS